MEYGLESLDRAMRSEWIDELEPRCDKYERNVKESAS